ncbi:MULTISPECIES: hypothetical protein [Bacillus]|uniref:Uncharacterized protein n=1 Tax=Bacillus glycinifermentans TaxID=1664069 RepID=A0A0T6BJ28_9BACI|nr:hypothetical protein [Bacillus glycinifermentans]ATH95206.1 hypothetical protein COP00_23645 [Bacillus glycinifermentans]KRT89374.1 hypothetical protein AB447_224205 [Bacillus glycinifermentans]MEC0483279.1 hypothetical protein [Bacillus glycinifermentans]MEC3606726.1 hypothetical protein [Bacillus glycinifermentans]NUJ17316.1 hypothetical protein [Bacillus glycinifermentans]
MPCSDEYANYVLKICTDADSYSPKATSIDVVAKYGGGSIANFKYTLSAEVWNKDYWESRKLLSGTFKKQTPTRVFKISQLKLKKGKNSVRIKGYFHDTVNGGNFQVKTPAFIVKR